MNKSLCCLFTDCLGCMCAGANRQRSHLWDHPGLLPRLRVQRWLHLAAVVKAAEGVARLGWNCFISFIIMIIIVLVLRLPFCSCICYLWWWPPSHINRQQQTSAIHGPFYFYCCFFFTACIMLNWTDTSGADNTGPQPDLVPHVDFGSLMSCVCDFPPCCCLCF